MALEDLQSQYGPTNKKGQKGTGEVADTFAREDGKGLQMGGSKYGSTSKVGTKPTGPDLFGNIPAERSGE